jgi:hypothetical protein
MDGVNGRNAGAISTKPVEGFLAQLQEPFDRLTENRSCVSSVSTIHGGRRANGTEKALNGFFLYLPSPNPFALRFYGLTQAFCMISGLNGRPD